MSRENVEVVRKSWEHFKRRDLDALIELFDPEIEWHDVPVLPGGGVHRGRDAFRRHAEGFIDAWGEVSVEIDELTPVGDQVVARLRYVGVGRGSGAPVRGLANGAVYDFRAGRILRVRQFLEHAEALEAAGPRE